MKPEPMIETLKAARARVANVHDGADIPRVQSFVHHADQTLHETIWNLGEVETPRSDVKG